MKHSEEQSRKTSEINDIRGIDEAECDPLLSRIMTSDRYWALSKYFHVADNSQAVQNWHDSNFDPLYKIRPMNHANIRFAAVYQPKQHTIAYSIFLLRRFVSRLL